MTLSEEMKILLKALVRISGFARSLFEKMLKGETDKI